MKNTGYTSPAGDYDNRQGQRAEIDDAIKCWEYDFSKRGAEQIAVTIHGQHVLEFIATHFDVRALTPDGQNAIDRWRHRRTKLRPQTNWCGSGKRPEQPAEPEQAAEPEQTTESSGPKPGPAGRYSMAQW